MDASTSEEMMDLNAAAMLACGLAPEPYRVSVGRIIQDQNCLYQMIMRAASPRSPRDMTPKRPVLPPFWPPSETLGSLAQNPSALPREREAIEEVARAMEIKWQDYNCRIAAAERKLIRAFEDGNLEIYFRQNGMREHHRIALAPQKLLEIRREQDAIVEFAPSTGNLEQSDQALVLRRYLRVRVRKSDVMRLFTGSQGRRDIERTGSATSRPSLDEIVRWLKETYVDSGRTFPPEPDLVAALEDQFGRFPKAREYLRAAKKMGGLQGKGGRPRAKK